MTLNGTVYLRDFNPFVELKVSADITIDGQPGKIRCRGALAVSNKGINGDSGGGGSVWKFTVSESDPYTFRIGVTHQGIHITQAVAELTLDPARNAINGSFGGVAVLDTVELALKMDIDEEEEADGSFVGKGIRLELDVSNDGTCFLVYLYMFIGLIRRRRVSKSSGSIVIPSSESSVLAHSCVCSSIINIINPVFLPNIRLLLIVPCSSSPSILPLLFSSSVYPLHS